MKTIAILNEKGGTAKTTTSVNLAASLGEMGKKVLLVDLDGQAASSRWLGVDGDTRLADALLRGSGLVPIENVIPGVSLAPASGKLDSISHNLRPTQGSQLRRVLAELKDRYDYVLIDCPPSLGNRLIGNALLAASHALVPVETSILALDGLRILLTMLDDIRQGFEHDIELIGALGCRFNSRTRLSRMVLSELHRALPGKVFGTVIHETVRMQECPASGKSILEYAPECSAAEDYRAVSRELVYGIKPCTVNIGAVDTTLTTCDSVGKTDLQKISDFRKHAGEIFRRPDRKSNINDAPVTPKTPETPKPPVADKEPAPEQPVASTEIKPPQDKTPEQPETRDKPQLPTRGINITPTPKPPARDETKTTADTAEKKVDMKTVVPKGLVKSTDFGQDEPDQPIKTTPKPYQTSRNRSTAVVGVAAAVLLGVLGVAGWVAFKAMTPAPKSAEARPSRVPMAIDQHNQPAIAGPVVADIPPVERDQDSVENKEGSPKTGQMTASLNRELETAEDPHEETEDAAEEETTVASTDKSVSEPPTTQPASKAPTTQPAVRIAKAEDYPNELTLTGVMYSKTSRRAIISGKILREGDKVDNAKVVKILPNSVEIEANGFRFLLGTGPRPVWIKTAQITPPNDETTGEVSTNTDSQE